MPRIMEIIAKETNGKSYQTEKYSYDSLVGIPSFDYDDTPLVKWKIDGETEPVRKFKDLSGLARQIQGTEPIISYFLDGSRHVYKVDDISYNKKIYPVIAGQIGVGCCKRVNGRMTPEEFYRKLVISLPNVANQGGFEDKGFFDSKVQKVNASPELKRIGIQFDSILPYKVTKDNPNAKADDNGIAMIQDYMMQTEKEMVADLARKGKINQDHYLLKDGSLEYSDSVRKGRGEDKYSLKKIRHNYQWVIGVSKSFNPESILDHTGKPNSDYIANLPLFNRTPVAFYENNYSDEVKFAVWYVRIRDKNRTRTPFDGVVKVEKILMPEEEDPGIDTEIVDLLTATLINERNPTCYGTDRRWANHLYPVYLTETFIKSRYMSTDTFLHLF